VVAVGNPFGLGHSATAGIVSARGRQIGAGPYDDFLQISAPINRGNSGGPTFNLRGEVIGVNTAIFSPNGGNVGIGFAVPAALANDIVAELKANGAVERGRLGVRIQHMGDDLAESLGLEKLQGALVASVDPSGPAAAAGLKAGDVILEVDGERVVEMRRLPRMMPRERCFRRAILSRRNHLDLKSARRRQEAFGHGRDDRGPGDDRRAGRAAPRGTRTGRWCATDASSAMTGRAVPRRDSGKRRSGRSGRTRGERRKWNRRFRPRSSPASSARARPASSGT